MSETLHVYVMGSDKGPVKVGIAADVERRRAALQTGSPERIEVLYSLEVRRDLARAAEAVAHSLLAEWRLEGEWFKMISTGVAAAAVLQGAVIAPTYELARRYPLWKLWPEARARLRLSLLAERPAWAPADAIERYFAGHEAML